MDEVYEVPVERLTAAGANGRQYELQSKSWDKVQDVLREMNSRATHDGQVAPNSDNSPVGEGHSRQVLGSGVASDAQRMHRPRHREPTLARRRIEARRLPWPFIPPKSSV